MEQTKYIKEIQEMLRTLHYAGYPVALVQSDGIFSYETAKAVIDFQKYAGIKETGTVDLETFQKLSAEYKLAQNKAADALGIFPFPSASGYTVSANEKSDLVTIIQIMLKDLSAYHGLPSVAMTGVYDAQTQSAVAIFKEIHGLAPNFVLDKSAWNAIARAYSDIV